MTLKWCSQLHSFCRENNSLLVLKTNMYKFADTLCLTVSWCFSQSQLSACSKALESSEELLEMANQTLCSSETDGFTQVTARASLCCNADPLTHWIVNGEYHCPYIHVYNLICPSCGILLAVMLTKPPATFLHQMTTWQAPTQFSLRSVSLLFSFPPVLLFSRRPKTLRIGIVLSHPLLPFIHSFLLPVSLLLM